MTNDERPRQNARVIATATENVHAALAAGAPNHVELRVARAGDVHGLEFVVVHEITPHHAELTNVVLAAGR